MKNNSYCGINYIKKLKPFKSFAKNSSVNFSKLIYNRKYGL